MSKIQASYYFDTKENKIIDLVEYQRKLSEWRTNCETLYDVARRYIAITFNYTLNRYIDSYRFVSEYGYVNTYSFAYTETEAEIRGKREIGRQRLDSIENLSEEKKAGMFLCERSFPLPAYIDLIEKHYDPRISLKINSLANDSLLTADVKEMALLNGEIKFNWKLGVLKTFNDLKKLS